MTATSNTRPHYANTNAALSAAIEMLDAIANGKSFDAFEYHGRLNAMKQARKEENPATAQEAQAKLFRVRQYIRAEYPNNLDRQNALALTLIPYCELQAACDAEDCERARLDPLTSFPVIPAAAEKAGR